MGRPNYQEMFLALAERVKNGQGLKDKKLCSSLAEMEVAIVYDRINELEALVKRFLHRRRCWECKNEDWHVDTRSPYVNCKKCGSQDTRRIKDEQHGGS